MPDKNCPFVEVYRVKFGKASAYFEPVHYHHCNAIFDVKFPAHWESGGGEKRIAHYQVCDELAHFGAGKGFVIVCEPVELPVGRELFKGNSRPRRNIEILVCELLGDWV